mmetsp:Transcript_72169/g.168920  ORF Transcript_72169/g.168920 Transcript_72169/m.168920 type:complete len:800 (+) Transcript_72169:45-2444(+)
MGGDSFARVVPSPPDEDDEDGGDSTTKGPSEIVQFTAAIYFVEESEEFLTVDIMRLGSMKGTIKVKFHTEDGSAKAGKHYTHAEGELVFQENEFRQSIQISTVASPFWSPTLEFKVHLSKPEGCSLGNYLRSCRVKVIDGDTFPSSKYETQLRQGKQGVQQIRAIGLLFEYWKLCFFQVPGVGRRSLVILFLDQFRNGYRIIKLTLNVYIVDVLFKMDDPTTEDKLLIPNSRSDTALLVGLFFILPMLAIHLAAVIKAKLDMPGHLRLFLQCCLFRKYLNYSEDARASVAPADMQNAIVRDSGNAANSYAKVLDLIAIIAELVVFTYYTIQSNPSAVIFILAMPTAMFIYFAFVSLLCRATIEQWKEAEALVLRVAAEVCNRYRLVADYFQRPAMNEAFQESSSILRQKLNRKHLADVNDDMFPKWLGPFFTGLYIAVDANRVFNGDITLGTFLATISILGSISDQFSSAYAVVMKLVDFTPPVKKLTVYFNKETDLLTWKAVNRVRRENTRKARDNLFTAPGTAEESAEPELKDVDKDKKGSGAVVYKTDLIPIRVVDMSYTHHGVTIFSNVSVQVPQGQLVAVTGPHGSGKATLLRLLGHVIFPQEGSIFIPSHLRVLHVTQEALILNAPPMQNLLFGCPNRKSVDPARIRSILEMMDMKATLRLVEEQLTQLARGEFPDNSVKSWSTANGGAWLDGLTYTEKVKIHLARAFIMNPEVLVLQRPLHHYDAATSRLMEDLLKDHVRQSGLALPEEGRASRRPRTCFFTVEDTSQAEAADMVMRIQDGTVVAESMGHLG